MQRLLYASIIAALLAVGCRCLNAPNAPSGLPVICHNAEYNFTFYLPASWPGYSVLLQHWDAVDGSRSQVTDHGPVIVLRHPKRNQTANGPPLHDY
jgi:hypothetical protein